MELQKAVGLLLALALPLWLLIEQVMYWQRSSKQPEKLLEVGGYSGKPMPRIQGRASRARAVRLASQRKTA